MVHQLIHIMNINSMQLTFKIKGWALPVRYKFRYSEAQKEYLTQYVYGRREDRHQGKSEGSTPEDKATISSILSMLLNDTFGHSSLD